MLLVNSDIYSIISGHRNYFLDQKEHLNNEIKRVCDMYNEENFKNNQLERKIVSLEKEYEMEKERLEKELNYFKDKVK